MIDQYPQVTTYGFNPKVGHLSFPTNEGEQQFSKPYSDETAKIIDQEVRSLVEEAYQRTEALIRAKMEGIERIATTLLDKEVISFEDVQRMLGDRPEGARRGGN